MRLFRDKSSSAESHLAHVQEHFLYHLGISSATTDIPATFKDVKFVCIGGTASRMEELAQHLAGELGLLLNGRSDVMRCSPKTERYSLFKVGPVLCASHGIGVASASVLLHELFKLIHLAGCVDVTLLRIGTCGGVGVEEGTVIISDGAVNGQLRHVYTWNVLGKPIERPVVADLDLVSELQACAKVGDHFPTIVGTTLCTDDFYEGQARLDGALCSFTVQDKVTFLLRLRELGVRNIEMESAGVLALCHAVGIRAAVACVCLVDRLVSEEPKNKSDLLEEYQRRPQMLAVRFIKSRLAAL
ncbi:uridine phosphorylase 1-like [Pomacea canaliculata]|uniref:uridine phosphorylase 1-like n=1 Tax=Pomacea canaliculata TaxID=400727 RepID=UPI000D72F349|nr:uridine phosphorylase 1-like [Pomacea canaliculata]